MLDFITSQFELLWQGAVSASRRSLAHSANFSGTVDAEQERH
jgi:hypothetical protein